jgi:hypothetical protein
MIVECTDNTSNALPDHYFILTADTRNTIYHVAVGKMYEVFAMGLWKSNIELLLLDDTNLPFWYPVQLFKVADPKLPSDWICAVNMRNEGGMLAIWGCERIVSDDAHNDALMEREPEALQVFQLETQRRQNA